MEGGSTAQSIYPAACLIVAQNKCRLFQFLELKEALRPYSSGCLKEVSSETRLPTSRNIGNWQLPIFEILEN